MKQKFLVKVKIEYKDEIEIDLGKLDIPEEEQDKLKVKGYSSWETEEKIMEAIKDEFLKTRSEKLCPVYLADKIDLELHKCIDFRREFENMRKIEHEVNTEDWNSHYSRQGYQVYQCKICGRYWGCRYQWDMGTGSDNKWKCFGKDKENIERHY